MIVLLLILLRLFSRSSVSLMKDMLGLLLCCRDSISFRVSSFCFCCLYCWFFLFTISEFRSDNCYTTSCSCLWISIVYCFSFNCCRSFSIYSSYCFNNLDYYISSFSLFFFLFIYYLFYYFCCYYCCYYYFYY